MAGERQARMADRIKVLVAERLEKGLRDPRMGFVTITDVRVTGDLQHASVFYTVLGGEEERTSTAEALRAATGLAMDFEGYVEADKINRGECDVVVCDGFSGNIALKAIEGAARFVTDLLRQAFTSSVRSKIGFLVSRPATELLRHHLDPNNHNGAVFLGLNGVVVKSHGSANAKGVANAVEVAARLLEDDITNRIKHDLAAVGTEGLAAK